MFDLKRFEAYGELRSNDIPKYLTQVVSDLYRDSEPLLEKCLGSCISVRQAEREGAFRDFTPEAKERKILEALRADRQALHMILRNHLIRCEKARANVYERIRSASMPAETPDDIAGTLSRELRLREIRDVLRAEKDFQKRKEMVQENVTNGNGDYLRACTSAPDSILPGDTLHDLQRAFAFKVMPDLETLEQQVIEREQVVRAKCAELNSTQLKILSTEGFEEDPLERTEHLHTFSARTEAEAWAGDVQVKQEQARQRVEAAHLSFDRDNHGTNMQAGEEA